MIIAITSSSRQIIIGRKVGQQEGSQAIAGSAWLVDEAERIGSSHLAPQPGDLVICVREDHLYGGPFPDDTCQ